MTVRPVLVAAVAAAVLALAQQPPAEPKPGGKKGGGFRNMMPEPLQVGDHTGFDAIFDGTLKNWDADPIHWRAEGGSLIGETTPEKQLKQNTFAIWRGGQPRDFELKLEIRMNSTNSGIQFRSVELPDVGKWVLKGYQADFDFNNTFTGLLYEERGRGFLAPRGTATWVEEGKKARTIAEIRNPDEIKSLIKQADWNQVHVVARNNVVMMILNGQLTHLSIDDDTQKRALGGFIGLQLHVGPPMKVEFRNIYLKQYGK